jgi:hypothetical protein
MNTSLVNQETERLIAIDDDELLAIAIGALSTDVRTYVKVELKQRGRIDIDFEYRWLHLIDSIKGNRFVPGDRIRYRGEVVEIEYVWQGLTEIEYMTSRFGLVRQSWVEEV